jgi:transcriptional regulator with XRE-family HTH domain
MSFTDTVHQTSLIVVSRYHFQDIERRIVEETYAKALGMRLRAIRQQQALSLQGVEEKSRGTWKAVVVGSYERGDRAITVQRLSDLARFYRVPVAELLPGADDVGGGAEPPPKLVLDLERLQQLDLDEAAQLARFTAQIQSMRGDYNGRVLTVRNDDLHTLSLIYGESASQLSERLIDWGVLRHEQGDGEPPEG